MFNYLERIYMEIDPSLNKGVTEKDMNYQMT